MSRKYRRTSITLPEPLYLHLKAAATARRCALYEVVTDALRSWLPAHYAPDGTPRTDPEED